MCGGDGKPLRILVVEDNLLIADMIVMALQLYGYDVIGPASNLKAGLALAQAEDIDGALLDVNLAGELCFPIAVVLRSRQVPFMFLSGYDDPTIVPPHLRSIRRIGKPFHIADLAAAAAETFDPRRPGGRD
jgi:DNA-binding response OmpR family regulator